MALLVSGGAAVSVVFVKVQPDLARERTRWREGKQWDKPFLLILGVVGPALTQLVCGLDKRFGWSPAPFAPLQAAAAMVFAAGVAITAWAMAVNPFFSAVVRIQTDRGHTVVGRGPYRFVRHPGYAGMSLATLSGPVVLGTWWGLAPAALLVVTIVLRTVLEDRTLHDELPGYREYAARVRHRIVPALW